MTTSPLTGAVREDLEKYIGEDLGGATVTSATVNVDEHGRITVEEIIFRRQDRKEVSLGLAGMRPDGTPREPAILSRPEPAPIIDADREQAKPIDADLVRSFV